MGGNEQVLEMDPVYSFTEPQRKGHHNPKLENIPLSHLQVHWQIYVCCVTSQPPYLIDGNPQRCILDHFYMRKSLNDKGGIILTF